MEFLGGDKSTLYSDFLSYKANMAILRKHLSNSHT